MTKKIIITVGKAGEVQYKLEGFQGQGCGKVADILSTVGREVKREQTPEYYLAGGAPEGVLVGNG